MSMRNKFGHLVGDVFVVTVGDQWFSKDTVVVLARDDGTKCPLFKRVTGGGDMSDDRWYADYENLRCIFKQDGEDYVEPFKPFDVTIHIDSEDKARQLYTVANASISSFTGLDQGAKGIQPEYGLLLDTYRLLGSKLKEIR